MEGTNSEFKEPASSAAKIAEEQIIKGEGERGHGTPIGRSNGDQGTRCQARPI